MLRKLTVALRSLRPKAEALGAASPPALTQAEALIEGAKEFLASVAIPAEQDARVAVLAHLLGTGAATTSAEFIDAVIRSGSPEHEILTELIEPALVRLGCLVQAGKVEALRYHDARAIAEALRARASLRNDHLGVWRGAVVVLGPPNSDGYLVGPTATVCREASLLTLEVPSLWPHQLDAVVRVLEPAAVVVAADSWLDDRLMRAFAAAVDELPVVLLAPWGMVDEQVAEAAGITRFADSKHLADIIWRLAR